MEDEEFQLLLKISDEIYYTFNITIGGRNRAKIDKDDEFVRKLDLLISYNLITRINTGRYVITEQGNEVAQFKNWTEYLNHRRYINKIYLEKDETDLKLSNLTVREFPKTKTRARWGFGLSIASLVIASIIAILQVNQFLNPKSLETDSKKKTLPEDSVREPVDHEKESRPAQLNDIDTTSVNDSLFSDTLHK